MIIVFGGAFNPPTIAHKEIYHFIHELVPVDKFIFLPVSKKYSKASLIEDKHRLQMLKILTADLKDAIVSEIETEDEEFLGTYQSLLKIKNQYPHQEVAFVLGADNLNHLDQWINAEKLVSEFKFIIVNRHKKNLDKLIEKKTLLKNHKNHFIILENFHSNISSSLFRETLDPYYVDEGIYHYIMKHDLYRGGKD